MAGKQNSNYLTYGDLLALLTSDNDDEVAVATELLVDVGDPAAESLVAEACNRRVKEEIRVRFLQIARRIGVPFSLGNCARLQQLVDDRSCAVASAATALVSQMLQGSTQAKFFLQLLTGRVFGKSKVGTRRRTAAPGIRSRNSRRTDSRTRPQ